MSNRRSTWSSSSRCCPVTHTRDSNSAGRARSAWMTGASLMASGRVPKMERTFSIVMAYQLRADFDGRSVRDQFPDFFDFGICHGNASLCPIHQPVEAPNPAAAVGEAVNHDIASGIHAQTLGPLPVGWVWIRNV